MIFLHFLLDKLGVGANSVAIIYVLSALLVSYYYYVNKPYTVNKSTAVWLNILVVGTGQFYLRQYIIGLIFLIFHLGFYLSLMIFGTNLEDGVVMMLFVAPTVISAVYSNITSNRVRERLHRNSMQEVAVRKYKLLVPYIERGIGFAPDTNILMHQALTLIAAFYDSNVHLFISKQVFKELEGLKKNKLPSVRNHAQIAFDIIELYQQENRLDLLDIPSSTYLMKNNLTNSNSDDRIIGSYLYALKEQRIPMLFLSNDKGARIIARNIGIPLQSV